MERGTEPSKIFWHLSKEVALSQLSSNLNGLSSREATERLKKYGLNTIKANTSVPTFVLFFFQFKSPITLLLILAALLSAGLGDLTDSLIILAIVLISSFLGFWQEKGATNAVSELLKMVQLQCSVKRDKEIREMPVEEIVPGDVVFLSAGDVVPGDALLLDSDELFVDEATFTGETYPVEKEYCVLPEDTPLAKRVNSLFMGSHVISGKATAIIFETGKRTEFGMISSGLSGIPETDFERGIRKFGYLLMEITLLLVIIIFAINVLLDKPILNSFLFSLALAVGLTPQLLPAIVSVNLSIGAKRMAKQQVIVKRLSSIENLGSMNILCSDKTGTITEGKVNLKDSLDSRGNHSDKVLLYAWLNASFQQGFHNPIDEAIRNSHKDEASTFTMQSEIPYDFIRKRLSVQVKSKTENLIVTKGALNSVLSICSRVELEEGKIENVEDSKVSILEQYQQLSDGGFRTLGVAYKVVDGAHDITKDDERMMVFLGFIVLFDPPKSGVTLTIQMLNKLGIKLKIITGDNALVAKSLVSQIGFKSPKILTGSQIQKMTNVALTHQVSTTNIFAEMEPNQKERIIWALKKAGHVVGFLGDGINDAPALHLADVGISVDSAVDVAKEAADIVLLSKDLNVLVNGIVEGRKTFTNTMKYIFMATSANFGNMFSMAGASLFLPFLPLLPKQILLTNLLTDFPEMAIATDRVDDQNIQSPQRWNLSFIKRFMIIFGLLSSIFDYLTFGILLFVLHANEKVFQTGWFLESVISATLIVLVVRTRKSFFKSLPGKYLSLATLIVLVVTMILPLTSLAPWFGFEKIPFEFYSWMLIIIIAYIISAELVKRWFYKKLFKIK